MRDEVDSAAGWVVVATAFVGMFVVYGIVYSFGAFFDSMAEDFGTGKGATALMFSITTAGYFGLGVFSGRAADRYGPRPLMLVGAVMLGAGLLATSRVRVDLGRLRHVRRRRRRRRRLRVRPDGGHRRRLVRAAAHDRARHRRRRHRRRHARARPAVGRLIDAHGWRTAYVVLGIGGAAVLLLASVGARRPPVDLTQPRCRCGGSCATAGSSSSTSSFVLLSSALFVPFVFIKTYATDEGIDAGPAAALVGIIGASSVVGRLGLAALGSRLDATRLMQLSFATMAASFADLARRR